MILRYSDPVHSVAPPLLRLKDSRPAYTEIQKKKYFFFGFGCDVEMDIFVTNDPFEMPSTKNKRYGRVAFISGVYGQSGILSGTLTVILAHPDFI